jgi:hypothetical protein
MEVRIVSSPISPRTLSRASPDFSVTCSTVVPFPSLSGQADRGYALLKTQIPDAPAAAARLVKLYLEDLLTPVEMSCPQGPPFITPVSPGLAEFLIDLRPLVPPFTRLVSERAIIPSPMSSGLACPRELLMTRGVPSLSCSAPERMLDYDFKAFSALRVADVKPPVSIPASILQELLGMARSRIVIASAQDYNLSASQSAALSLLRHAEALRLPAFFMDTIVDLITLLKGSDVLWTEGMKQDAVLLANLSIIQRDSYLTLCPQLQPLVASLWRAQPFLSERVFGMDDASNRPDLPAPTSSDLRLHLGVNEVHPLALADKVLLASETRFLPMEDEIPLSADN